MLYFISLSDYLSVKKKKKKKKKKKIKKIKKRLTKKEILIVSPASRTICHPMLPYRRVNTTPSINK